MNMKTKISFLWIFVMINMLMADIVDTLLEAKVLIDRWRQHYNHVRPHSSLGYRPPVPEAVIPTEPKTILYAN